MKSKEQMSMLHFAHFASPEKMFNISKQVHMSEQHRKCVERLQKKAKTNKVLVSFEKPSKHLFF